MARAAFDLSAQGLADLAQVARMSVVRFERGENITAETQDRIASALAEKGAAFTRRAGRVGVTVPE